MGYILKNTTGLINSKLTDTARQMLSQQSLEPRDLMSSLRYACILVKHLAMQDAKTQ